MEFSIIAAVDNNRGIGKSGKLPWALKGDMAHFKAVTTREVAPGQQNAVIMGRTTWVSLPERFRPLPGRLNVVLSRQAGGLKLPTGVEQAASLNNALLALAAAKVGEVFIIGGGSVYAEAVQHPQCTAIYLTEIDTSFECDTFFPELPAAFAEDLRSEPQSEGGLNYQFVTYRRHA